MNPRNLCLNQNLNMWESYFQQEIVRSFPPDVGVPAGDRCNIRCIFCTERGGTHNAPYKNVSFEDFLKFSAPLAYASSIQIQGWGEPLLNPDYKKIFDYVITTCGGTIKLNTNGILLNDAWVEALIAAGDRVCLNVSLNAASGKTYKRVTGGDHFDQVIANVENLIKSRQNKGASGPLVSISLVGMKTNIHEFPALVDRAADLGVDCVILRELMVLREAHMKEVLTGYSEITKKSLKKACEIAQKRGILLDLSTFPAGQYLYGTDTCTQKMTTSSCSLRNETSPGRYSAADSFVKGVNCSDPWSSFIIDTTGNVRICCYSDTIMGNIFQQSFREIWNGWPYRYYRKYVNSPTPPDECTTCIKKTG